MTGGALGIVLAAGNVYTGLKINSIDGGSITAALLGFALFATFKRLERKPYTALENNITQTTASSAAIASYVTGVAGPVQPSISSGTTTRGGRSCSGGSPSAWSGSSPPPCCARS